MAYDREQLIMALRNADAAGDAEGAARIAQIIQAQGVQQQAQEPQATPPEPGTYAQGMANTNATLANSRDADIAAAKGLRERAIDAITGSRQMTPELEGLQNVGAAPELNELSMNAFKAGIGQLFGSDASQMKILQNMGGKLSQDSKGNVVVSLPSGDYALNKPGLSPQDALSFIANASAFTPAARGASILGAAGKSAATDIALQGSVQTAGGERIDPLQTVISGGIGGVGKAAEQGISAAARATRGTIAPDKQAAIDFAKQNNLPLMTSDVLSDKTFMQKQAQTFGERIPFFGTGKNRLKQQEARENLVRTYSDGVGDISDAQLYKSASKGQQQFIQAAGDRYKRIINAMGDTPVDITNTVKSIDAQIAKITQPGASQDRSAVSVLQQFKGDITSGPNNLQLARENRTNLRKRFMAASDEVDRDTLQKSSDAVYQAYTSDMKRAVENNLGPQEAANMARVDRSWAKFNDMMGNTRVQRAIQSGKTTPEDVTKLVFSQSPAERSQLYRMLDDNGRQNARAALVQRAVEKSTDPSGNISVEKFINEMHRNRKQAATFFRGENGKQLDGVVKYLDGTRQASKANVQNLNGQQLYGLLFGGGLINAAALAGMMKTAAAVIPTAAAVGGAAKGYESRIARNALLRLANTPKGSTAYDRAISRVSETLTPIIQSSAQEAAK